MFCATVAFSASVHSFISTALALSTTAQAHFAIALDLPKTARAIWTTARVQCASSWVHFKTANTQLKDCTCAYMRRYPEEYKNELKALIERVRLLEHAHKF